MALNLVGDGDGSAGNQGPNILGVQMLTAVAPSSQVASGREGSGERRGSRDLVVSQQGSASPSSLPWPAMAVSATALTHNQLFLRPVGLQPHPLSTPLYPTAKYIIPRSPVRSQTQP